jgi:hypothetical protein
MPSGAEVRVRQRQRLRLPNRIRMGRLSSEMSFPNPYADLVYCLMRLVVGLLFAMSWRTKNSWFPTWGTGSGYDRAGILRRLDRTSGRAADRVWSVDAHRSPL